MRLTAQVQVNTRVKELRNAAYSASVEFAEALGQVVLAQAKQNVSPGYGPGPHPHVTRHEDTGNLMRRIFMDIQRAGFMVFARVYTDVPYGTYLEVGWTTSTGRFVRYPWLSPAAQYARQFIARILRTTYRTYFTDKATFSRAARISTPTPVLATLPR